MGVPDTEGAPMGWRPKHSFKEHVKDPNLIESEVREREVAESAPPPAPRELADLVSAMGRRRLEDEELEKVRAAGDQVVPLLLNLLRDGKSVTRRYGKDELDGSFIETALDLLEPFGQPPAEVLQPVLRHRNELLRSYALYHLARCGNDAAVDALRAGLGSPSEECRLWTLMGLEFLKDSPRGSKKFRAALFEATLPLLAGKATDGAEHVPRALLALDFDRAKLVLLSGDAFRPGNKSIGHILRALKDANLSAPGPQLRNLLAGIKKKAVDFPFDYAYAYGLILLARAEGPGAGGLIADARRWGNETVREGAAEASGVAAGVADPYGFVCGLRRRKGVKGLTKPQLFYLTLRLLDMEVQNGRFAQFYFNSSGTLAPYAVKAAVAVGARKLAAVIRKANALFGKDGPDQNRTKRMSQLSDIDLEDLEDLDAQYYSCPERLSELLPSFVAAHAEAFKPAP
jgi:hypothetical protein